MPRLGAASSCSSGRAVAADGSRPRVAHELGGERSPVVLVGEAAAEAGGADEVATHDLELGVGRAAVRGRVEHDTVAVAEGRGRDEADAALRDVRDLDRDRGAGAQVDALHDAAREPHRERATRGDALRGRHGLGEQPSDDDVAHARPRARLAAAHDRSTGAVAHEVAEREDLRRARSRRAAPRARPGSACSGGRAA